MDLTTAFIISALPAIFILYLIYKRDKARPEPTNVIIKIFFLGGLFSVVLAGIIEAYLLNENIEINSFFSAIKFGVIPGFVEEILKFLAILIFAYKIREFDEKTDGIIYALCVGMGFAAFENLGYLFGFGAPVIFWRALTAVPFHAIAAVIMGYFIGRAKFSSQNKFLLFLLALLIPIIIHTLYDGLLVYFGQNDLFSLILIGGVILFGIIGIVFSLRLTSESVKEEFNIYR